MVFGLDMQFFGRKMAKEKLGLCNSNKIIGLAVGPFEGVAPLRECPHLEN